MSKVLNIRCCCVVVVVVVIFPIFSSILPLKFLSVKNMIKKCCVVLSLLSLPLESDFTFSSFLLPAALLPW